MKIRTTLPMLIGLFFGALLHQVNAFANDTTMTGTIHLAAVDHIIFEHQIYPLKPLMKGVDMRKALGGKATTNAFDVEVIYTNGRSMGYGMILGIGYVQKAEITISDGEVSRIQILEIAQ